MRILVVPLIGLSNIASDSNFLVYKDLILRSAFTKGWYWYMILPKKGEGQVKQLPKTKYIYVDMSPDFFQESMSVPPGLIDLFSRRAGKYVIDLIVTSRVGGSIMMQSQLSDFRRTNPVPVFIFEPMVRAWKRPNSVDATLRALSYCHSYVWLLSEEEKIRAMSMISKVATPSVYQDFIKNSQCFGIGVRIKDLDKFIKNEKNKKFQLFFGARFSKEKRPDKVLDMFGKFFSFGRDIDIVITTQHLSSIQMGKVVKSGDFSSVKEMIKGCSREKFLYEASRSHIFLCASDDEGWPTGFWEQLYLVQVGVFPNKTWVRAVLPKEYPYVYNNQIEAHTLLRWIYENYDEAVKKVSWIRDWIRKNANHRIMTDRVLDWLEQIPKPYLHLGRENYKKKERITQFDIVKESAEYLYKTQRIIRFNDLLYEIKKKSESWNPFRLSRLMYPTKYEVYRTLLDLGYKDTMDSDEPIFYKV